ncbi:MAG TPA: TerB family tellurite resistance protein [Flavobacteriales bacterium]|nr:TerB family tellurite resistance protein [Flavobacteriales bacterium]
MGFWFYFATRPWSATADALPTELFPLGFLVFLKLKILQSPGALPTVLIPIFPLEIIQRGIAKIVNIPFAQNFFVLTLTPLFTIDFNTLIMARRKLNKVMAGYHILMIISNADGEFSPEEGIQMVDYMSDSFPFDVSLDNELDELLKLKREDYFNHFVNAMDDFYIDSTAEERSKFLNNAVKMVMADKKITSEESMYLREIFNAWEPETEI